MQHYAITFILLISFSLLSPWHCSAGDTAAKIRTYRIFQRNGEVLTLKNAYLGSDAVITLEKHYVEVTYPYKEIIKIQQQSGNYLGKGARIGSQIGLGVSILVLGVACIEVAGDQNKRLNTEGLLPFFIVNTGLGALVGATIGAAIPAWKDVPARPQITISPKKNIPSISLTYRFQ